MTSPARPSATAHQPAYPRRTMARPTIAITCSVGDIRSGEWDEHAAYSPIAYVRAVQRAGARAILSSPTTPDADDPHDLLATLDGVILSGGGSDVAPHRYGQEPHPATAAEEPGRDAFELALTRAAREHDIPLLGICRGMQLLNVAYGGTLHQHLPDVLGHDEHRVLPADFARHEVRIEPGSLAAAATGAQTENVLSHHHQGPDAIGDGLDGHRPVGARRRARGHRGPAGALPARASSGTPRRTSARASSARSSRPRANGSVRTRLDFAAPGYVRSRHIPACQCQGRCIRVPRYENVDEGYLDQRQLKSGRRGLGPAGRAWASPTSSPATSPAGTSASPRAAGAAC